MFRKVFELLLTCWMVLALGMLLWGTWPIPTTGASVTLSPQELGLEAEGEARLQTILWPTWIRKGDQATVRLELRLTEEQGGAEANDNREPQVILVARLELPGVVQIPPGEILQALVPGRPLELRWEIRPAETGVYPAVIWLHIRSIAQDEKDALLLVSAARQELRVDSLLGLSGRTARLSGIAGLFLGLILIGTLLAKREQNSRGK